MMQLNIDTEELKSVIEKVIRQELKKFLDQIATPKNETKEFLTAEETADFLHLKKDTIYRLVQRKEIPHSKPGKILYFLREDLIQWIKKWRVASESELEEEVDVMLANNIGRKISGNENIIKLIKGE